jgi:hypothetical protein
MFREVMMSSKQYVVCAANRNEVTGLIICGARHWDDLMCAQADAAGYELSATSDPWEQGFVDQFGSFLTREEAAVIVKESNQTLHGELDEMLKTYLRNDYLFSEHLY